MKYLFSFVSLFMFNKSVVIVIVIVIIHNTSCTYAIHLTLFSLTLQFTEIKARVCSHDIRQCPSHLTLHQQRNTTEGVSTVACVGQW